MQSKFKGLALFVAAGVCAVSPSASAASSGSGTITDITIEGANFARVALSVAPTGTRPTCHNTGYVYHFALDISSSKGKALLSAAQTAQLSGKSVYIQGAGSCTNIGAVTIETLALLTVWT